MVAITFSLFPLDRVAVNSVGDGTTPDFVR
jgi:hypothetical protein